jgi:hypothetical protein
MSFRSPLEPSIHFSFCPIWSNRSNLIEAAVLDALHNARHRLPVKETEDETDRDSRYLRRGGATCIIGAVGDSHRAPPCAQSAPRMRGAEAGLGLKRFDSRAGRARSLAAIVLQRRMVSAGRSLTSDRRPGASGA